MRFSLILGMISLVAALGCARTHSSKVQYGVTTAAALKADKGEPASVERPYPERQLEMMVYAGNEKFQVEHGVVIAGYRRPTPAERTLLYWRHKFRNCETTFVPVVGQDEMELKCLQEGTTVIYNPQADAILRVVEPAHN